MASSTDIFITCSRCPLLSSSGDEVINKHLQKIFRNMFRSFNTRYALSSSNFFCLVKLALCWQLCLATTGVGGAGAALWGGC